MSNLPKEDQEFIKKNVPNPEEKLPWENELPEAPASATLSVVTPKGYNTLFTLREMTGIALLDKITAVEKQLEERGYKPQVRGFAKKEIKYIEGKMCPKDGGRLKEIVSRKDGKTYWTCENGHYDYNTKTTSGCNFICSPENYEAKVQEINFEAENGVDTY